MNASRSRSIRIGGLVALLLGSSAFSAFADEVEVRIVNMTRGQVFSPVIAWSHNRSFTPFFAFGQPASEDVRAIAEDGNSGPLAATLGGDGTVNDIVTGEGPIPPGGTATLTVDIEGGKRLISLGSMLVNTNDTFFALRGVKAPRRGQSVAFFQPGQAPKTTMRTARTFRARPAPISTPAISLILMTAKGTSSPRKAFTGRQAASRPAISTHRSRTGGTPSPISC